jgi:ribose transport system substrate-binding protein
MQEVAWPIQRLHRRKLLSGTLAIATGTLFLSCESSTAHTTTNPVQQGFVIALVKGLQEDAFYTTMQKGAQAKADELHVSLLVDGPTSFDAKLQTPIVNAMIAKKVDALIIAACDKEAMIKPLQRAHDANIKVISVDTYIGDGDYAHGPVTFPISYIGSDNVEGGRMAGIALIKALGGSGKIYIQNVNMHISTNAQREQGCRSAIQATNGAVTLVGVDYNNDNPTTARQQTTVMLRRVGDLAGIFGANLFSAEGADEAVKEANKQGIIKIASFDAPEQAIVDLRNGVIDFVIAQKPADMGRIAVDYAVKALQGQASGLQKRVVTGYVIIDNDNVNTPDAQNAIYKSK